jgi:hypothetical protein
VKLILRQLGYLVLFFLPFYGLLLFWSMVSYQPQKFLDTEEAPKTIFSTGPKYIVLGRSPLRNASHNIFLLGSSNTAQGFRPPQLQPLLPRYEIHNLAIGGSNVTQTRQIIDLVYEVLPPASKSHNIFVLGIWYGLFVDNQTRWKNGDTFIDIEKLRSPLYKKENGQVKLCLPSRFLDYFTGLTRPYLFMDKVVQAFFPADVIDFNEWVAHKFARRPDQDTVILDDNYKKTALAFWKDYMGSGNDGLPEDQFLMLDQLVDIIVQNRDKIIIIDLPIPKWHSENSRFFRDYQKKKKPFLEKIIASKKARYFNYQDMDSEFDFYDSAHPKPKIAKKWSERLGNDLRQLGVMSK